MQFSDHLIFTLTLMGDHENIKTKPTVKYFLVLSLGEGILQHYPRNPRPNTVGTTRYLSQL